MVLGRAACAEQRRDRARSRVRGSARRRTRAACRGGPCAERVQRAPRRARASTRPGPAPSLQQVRSAANWWQLHEPPPQTALWPPLPPEQRARPGSTRHRARLTGYVADAFFNRGGRDFESIGLGWLEPRASALEALPLPAGVDSEAVRSAIRVLGLAGPLSPAGWAEDSRHPGRRCASYVDRARRRSTASTPRSCCGELEAGAGGVAASSTRLGTAARAAFRVALAESRRPAALALRALRPRAPASLSAASARPRLQLDEHLDEVVTRAATSTTTTSGSRASPAPAARRGADRPDEAALRAARAAALASRAPCSSRRGERAHRRDRRPQRHHDDGGRRRHRRRCARW